MPKLTGKSSSNTICRLSLRIHFQSKYGEMQNKKYGKGNWFTPSSYYCLALLLHEAILTRKFRYAIRKSPVTALPDQNAKWKGLMAYGLWVNPLSVYPTKWSNTLKQFAGLLTWNVQLILLHLMGSQNCFFGITFANMSLVSTSFVRYWQNAICALLKSISFIV